MKEETAKRYLQKLAEAIEKGFHYNPGHSDLDNEQPIVVWMDLGTYRLASSVLYSLKEEK